MEPGDADVHSEEEQGDPGLAAAAETEVIVGKFRWKWWAMITLAALLGWLLVLLLLAGSTGRG